MGQIGLVLVIYLLYVNGISTFQRLLLLTLFYSIAKIPLCRLAVYTAPKPE